MSPDSQRSTVATAAQRVCANSLFEKPSAFRVFRMRLGVSLSVVTDPLSNVACETGRAFRRPLFLADAGLEMETDLTRDRARGHVVGAAEGREIVVQRHLVRQIDDRHPRAPLEPVAVEHIIVAHR
jgi:hypothetical protein